MNTFLLFILSAALVASPFAMPASAQVACTMDAKQCPDGSYVGRTGPNCEFAACPDPCAIGACPRESQRCDPYACKDGTRVPKCATDGSVINYVADPCLTHGGETDCRSECRSVGTRSEGWYDSCSGALIEFARCASSPFSDVVGAHPNVEAIAYIKAKGIVEGYADGTFKPDQTINRAEFTKIVVGSTYTQKALDICDPSIMVRFSDTDTNAWYAPYLCIAAQHAIVAGYPDGTFGSANSVNFVEAAKIISLSFEIAAPSMAPNDPWYAPYVRDLERHGAIPLSIVTFDQKITRGEMAEMIWRLKAGVKDLPSQTFDSLSTLADPAKQDGSSDSSCADAFRTTGMCPQDRCVMDCADRDNPPKDGLGCPPGCFGK